MRSVSFWGVSVAASHVADIFSNVIFIDTSGSYANVVLFLIKCANCVCVWNYSYKLIRLAHRTTYSDLITRLQVLQAQLSRALHDKSWGDPG